MRSASFAAGVGAAELASVSVGVSLSGTVAVAISRMSVIARWRAQRCVDEG